MKVVPAVAAAAAGIVVASLVVSHANGSGSCPLPTYGPGEDYAPKITASEFSADVTNPWFPLSPGTTFLYAGTKDDKPALDVFAVSRETVKVAGVTTRVVEDRLFLDGVLEERTRDYYAQDSCGNVWYFGEDTAVLDEKGKVLETDGTFHAGEDDAQPGVYLQADPEKGRRFRQEWAPDEAEDEFQALSKDASVTVRYGAFQHALQTQETTALEPGVVDHKHYVRGLGQVEEVAVAGGTERLELIDVLH